MQMYRVPNTSTFIIDTPGFDDPTRSDIEILQSIASCLADMHEGLTFADKEIDLSGIIYMHSINDGRMIGSTMKNLRMFQHLVGKKSMKHCVFVTSKWALEDESRAKERERELITDPSFWNVPLAKGASIRRYEDSTQSALDIIDLCTQAGMFVPLLTREYVLEGKELQQTAAGQAIDRDMVEGRERHETQLQELEGEYHRALEACKMNEIEYFQSQLSEMEAKLKIKEDGLEQFRLTRDEEQKRLDELESIVSDLEGKSDKAATTDKRTARQKRAFRWFARLAALGVATSITVVSHGVMAPVGLSIYGAVETVCQAQKDREVQRLRIKQQVDD